MEYRMNLHENKQLFSDLILFASEMLEIEEVYIEKDYWITRSLQRMAQNANREISIIVPIFIFGKSAKRTIRKNSPFLRFVLFGK